MKELDTATGIDLNSASAEALMALPGVDETIAKAIIDYREEHGPIATPQVLLQIEGIDEATLARITPHLQIGTGGTAKAASTPPDTEAPAEASAPTPPPEAEAAAPPKPERRPPTPPPPRHTTSPPPAAAPSPPRTRSGRIAWWAWLWSALIGGLLGMIFTLIVLSGINGSLNINHSRSVQENRSRIDALQADLDRLGGQIDGLDGRLRTLEGLTARMDDLEGQMAQLDRQVATLREETESVHGELDAMQTTIGQLETEQQKMQDFFHKLQALIAATFTSADKEEPTPQVSPLSPPTMPPTGGEP